jgi:hypothetical protein
MVQEREKGALMLVDITPLYADRSRIPEQALKVWDSLSAREQANMIPERIQQGVWDGGLNPVYLCANQDKLDDFVMRRSNMFQTFEDEREAWDFFRQEGFKFLSCYGVCDSPENLLEHPDYKEILNHPQRRFTVFLAEIRKEDQGERGWRWHKWGPYIGAHEPQYEYLADEEGIERVFVFQIVEHIDPSPAETSATQ